MNFSPEDFIYSKQTSCGIHLGLHCLPKHPFRAFQYTKGQGVPQDMFSFRNLKDTLDIDLGHVGHFNVVCH